MRTKQYYRPAKPEILIFKSVDGIQTRNSVSDCTHARLGYIKLNSFSVCPDVGLLSSVDSHGGF